MIGFCPAAPAAKNDLDVTLAELRVNSELVRFHPPAYEGNAFNPNTGRKMADPTAGARFSPFPDLHGVNVPTTYAGSTTQASALESVFHDVPHVPDPPYPANKLRDFVLSRLRVRRPITILELVNPQLRQVTVPGRAESLAEGELIHTKAAEYPGTRAWARYFHHSLPHLEGLAWRPRLGGEGLAYVFFGDRVAPTDFEIVESATPIDTGSGRELIDVIAGEAHIVIIAVR